MPSLTELSAASSVAAADQLLINQSGTDKRVTADKFGIITTGAWTPEISTAGGSGITHGTRSGTYVKIGSLVMIAAYVSLTSKGTASGSLFVGGFPFLVGGVANTIYTWAVDRNNLASNYTEMIMQVAPGWTWGRLRGSPGADTSLVQLDAAILTNTTSFVFSGMYQAG